MNREGDNSYYWGEKFGAVSQNLDSGGGRVWFILPEVMHFILDDGNWEQQKYLQVNFSVPKFDVSSHMDLIDGLKSLEITRV